MLVNDVSRRHKKYWGFIDKCIEPYLEIISILKQSPHNLFCNVYQGELSRYLSICI